MDACAIIGFGTAQASMEEFARLRKDPGPTRPEAMEHQILKHADELTVLALVAMMNGLAGFPPGSNFADWAVVAAPRWPGRFGTIRALDGLKADGIRGVSPMTIPHHVLHALSGTVSLVFAMRGPNFGVGGGQTCIRDGLLASLSVQLEQQPPGTWVIFSEWDVEPGQVGATDMPQARALALALGSVAQAPNNRRLLLRPSAGSNRHPEHQRLGGLIDFVGADCNPTADAARLAWHCALDWGMELVMTEGMSKV
jgi:hypothetical protein